MTAKEYDAAYNARFAGTVRLLVSRGIAYDTAQAAWAKGWECRSQLRNVQAVCVWMNRIAINAHRASLRRAATLRYFPEQLDYINLAAIDVEHVLSRCKPKEASLLKAYYLDGYRTSGIANVRGCSEVAIGIRLFRVWQKAMRLLCGPTRLRRRPAQL